MTKVAKNPLSARASVIRYWKAHVSGNLPPPPFLLSKASPLNAMELAKFTRIAAQNNLSSNLGSFCSSANLLCSLDNSKPGQDPNFALYFGKSFSGYGSSRIGGVGLFKNYSDGLNTLLIPSMNTVETQSHTQKSSKVTPKMSMLLLITSPITASAPQVAPGISHPMTDELTCRILDLSCMIPTLILISFHFQAISRRQMQALKRSQVTERTAMQFRPSSTATATTPTISGQILRVIVSGNAANNSFKGYGDSGNTPHNNFKTYGVGANSGIDKFTSYLDGANSGDDTFQSYTSHAHSGEVNFANYGKTFNPVNDTFKEYGRGSFGDPMIGFKTYGSNPNFINYHKKGVTFSEYTAGGISPVSSPASSPTLFVVIYKIELNVVEG
ncbi:hypothetical protein SLE2022_147040 [Rubroshorea leprosula]